MGRLIQLDGRLIDADEQLMQLDRADYEDSLYLFLKTAWPYIDPAPWKDGWPIEAIAEHLEAVVDGQIKRLIINVPPRTSKTSLCSIAFPAWCWAQPTDTPTSGPGVRFMYASYGESLSLDHSTYCRRLIKSEWYQKYWKERYGLLSDQDTKHKFTNSKMGERQITSIDARVTGRGGQIILIDDPNATNEAESEAKIQTVTDWWDQTMNSRLNDRETGAFILIQQRVAENDLTGHILEKYANGWDHLVLPMKYEADRSFSTSIGWKDPRTEEGQLLWPERFSAPVVEALEREAGPWMFAGQYQQRPEPKGGGVIRRDWWNLWKEPAFPPMDYILASLDTAYTEKTENDYSAITVWGVFSVNTQETPTRRQDREGRIIDRATYAPEAPKVMLMTAWQERLPLHELVNKVAETCKKLSIDLLMIENKAAGISVAQEMRRLYGHEKFGVMLKDPKSTDKLSRLHSVAPLFAPEEKTVNGKTVVTRPGIVYAPDRAWADMVITQVGVFPHGKHDDLVDTVSMGLRHLRDIGVLQLAPEIATEIEDSKQYDRVKQPAPLYPG